MSVVVNGRFLTQAVTGVQRYGREVLARLPGEPVVAMPGDGRIAAAAALTAGRPARGGLAGHAWEQVVLPRLLTGDEVLVGFSNSGPVRVRRQVVTLYDAAPWEAADHFSAGYRRLARAVWPRLARTADTVVTISERSRRDLARHLGVDRDRFRVIPPGVGAPFTDDPGHRGRDASCLFVGGHDPRKNLGFLVDLWPAVAASTGLELVVVTRSASRAHAPSPVPAGGAVRVVCDPDDATLAGLYRRARCLLFPSSYEGFGLPLLEAMACGTPFLATNAGAAPQLAVDRSLQILPLDPGRWIDAIRELARRGDDLGTASRGTAARYTWAAAGEAWSSLLGAAVAA